MRHACIVTGKCVSVICTAAILQVALVGPAVAEVTRVVVKASGTMGTFGGRHYT